MSLLRQVPYITKLRVSEIATALTILLKGPVILEILESLDNNEKIDFEQLEEQETQTAFNVHDFRK